MTAAAPADPRRETIESWVSMIGRVSKLPVERVLDRLHVEPDLVDTLDAVLSSRPTAFGQFEALRDYLVGELFVESDAPVRTPIVQRHPSPWDVPRDLLSRAFEKKTPRIVQYFDSVVIVPSRHLAVDELPFGHATRLFTNANLGNYERTNLVIGNHLRGRVLLTSWWILVPSPETSFLSQCSIQLSINQRTEASLNAYALLTPRPLFMFYPPRSELRVDLNTRAQGPFDGPETPTP